MITPPLEHAHKERTFGQRAADTVVGFIGSWRFIIAQSCILIVWIILNVLGWINHWDPYPFILLNLALSFQAAYASPMILMSQNRQTEIDHLKAERDFYINRKAEKEIEDIQASLHTIEHNQLDLILTRLIAIETQLNVKK